MKLAFIAVIFLAVILGLTLSSYLASESIGQTGEIVEEISYKVEAVANLQVEFGRLAVPVHDYLLTGDPAERGKYADLARRFEERIRALEALDLEEEEERRILISVKEEYLVINEIALELLKTTVFDEAAERRMIELDMRIERGIVELEKLHEFSYNEYLELIDAIKAAENRTRRIHFIGVVTGMIVGVLLIWYLASSFVNPLLELKAGAKRLAGGELGHRVRIRTGDEIEELAEEFNSMAARLQESIQNLEVEVEERTRKLQHSNELKDLFTDIMRHDLLNPAGVVRGVSEILLVESPGREELQVLKRSADKLIAMIESASKLSKLESAEKLEKKSLDLKMVIDNVVMDCKPLLESAGMRVNNRVSASMPLKANPVIGDVFLNLLSNAAKYAAEGKKVVIEALEEDESIKVMVKDYGSGIPHEDKKDIFHRFTRREKAGVKGAGLGLAIVKRIVDLHNGEVWVEDNPEGGSIFIVQLPKEGG